MLKNKMPVVIFIIAALIGAILIIWYLKAASRNDASSVVLEQEIEAEDMQDMEGVSEYSGDPQNDLSGRIPQGMKAVNLPISFFGSSLMLKTGDKVDIISTYYDKESAMLYAETILSEKEIIALESGQDQEEDSYGSIGGNIFPESSFGADINNGTNRTLIITFFLEGEEIVKSFKAIESGMLYLALCPGNNINTKY